MIKRIKQEIEQRISDNTFGAKLELIDLLSFIESLEKEEPPRICPKCIHYKEDMCQEPYGGMTSKINRNGIYDCTAFIENTLFEVPPKIKGWVARDKRGTLNFFRAHPRRITDSRGEEYWIGHVRMKQPNEFFPDLKWEDEPIEVELTISRVKTE